MDTKNPIKALFSLNDGGYITGFQTEFWDGKNWQTTFDTSKAVEVDPAELNKIVFGATKYTGGKLVIDKDKRAELENNQPKPEPSAADSANAETMKMVASITMSNAALIKQVATLTKEAKS
ncbi:phage infection protein [Lacticaseibacillus paracasei]|uniref:phage infection protein n=1 Tax=Lacticaseibacillus paracasei TaxID=1597 RepID=UPI0021A93017|nr:phage infection protein [Lacticaseibacillus paracasei]MCT4383891.1 phage infection protein [Lacticaseibacillus paracasei]